VEYCNAELSILEAKSKILNKLRDIIPITEALNTVVNDISRKYSIPFDELWPWTLEQIFLYADKPTIETVVEAASKQVPPKRMIAHTDTQRPRPPISTPTIIRRKAPPQEAKAQQPKAQQPPPKSDEILRYENAQNEVKQIIVKKTKDIDLLQKALQNTCPNVRLKAVNNPNIPEEFLHRIIMNDSNLNVRRVAIRHIKNQAFLKQMASDKEGDVTVRQKAIRRINSASFLEKLLDGKEPRVIERYIESSIKNLKNLKRK
jgi:hypothetical protein